MNADRAWNAAYSAALEAAGGTPPEKRYCKDCKWSRFQWWRVRSRGWWLLLRRARRRQVLFEHMVCAHADTAVEIPELSQFSDHPGRVLGPAPPVAHTCDWNRSSGYESACGAEGKLWERRV